MHNSILAKRNHASHARMLITAQMLAEHLNIDPRKVAALTPKGKDKDVSLMRQREAVADLLDDIALSLGIDIPANGKPIEVEQFEAVKEDDQILSKSEDGTSEVMNGSEESEAADQNHEGDQEPDGDDDGEPAENQDPNVELPPPVVEEG